MKQTAIWGAKSPLPVWLAPTAIGYDPAASFIYEAYNSPSNPK